MPRAHRARREWSPSRLVHWGATIGPATQTLVQQILASCRIPSKGIDRAPAHAFQGEHQPVARNRSHDSLGEPTVTDAILARSAY
jgi:hypothetical protein